MRVLLLGVGKIGFAMLKDLVQSSEVSKIVAADVDIQKARRRANELGSDKTTSEHFDITDHERTVRLMKTGFDVVASALLAEYNLEAARAAVEAGVSMVDVGATPAQVFDLDREAQQRGVTILPSCGLDPGIDRILEGYGARKLDKVTEIQMFCGGFPQKNTLAYNNLLRYKVSWYWKRAIETNLGKATILRDGRLIQVDKLTGPGNPEIIVFREPVGECEAFYSGAPLDTIEHLGLKDVKNAWERTARWPGHCEIWTKLIDLGLVSAEPLEVKGCQIAPKDFLVELGNKTLQYQRGEGDVVVQRVRVIGEKDGEEMQYVYELIDFYDKERDVTAMGRTTAYPCSILSQMIGHGDIRERGVIHASKIGWDAKLSSRFFLELTKRNIRISETSVQSLT
jgi:lysine 6-dehydrogenase